VMNMSVYHGFSFNMVYLYCNNYGSTIIYILQAVHNIATTGRPSQSPVKRQFRGRYHYNIILDKQSVS
jgi:hypothetical protein